MGSTYLVPGGTSRLHHRRRMTTRNHQLIQHHCTVTDVMAEGIGLLIVLSGNAICVEGMAMKQETVNPVPKSGGQNKNGIPMPPTQVSAGCLVQSSPPQATAEDIQSCIEGEVPF